MHFIIIIINFLINLLVGIPNPGSLYTRFITQKLQFFLIFFYFLWLLVFLLVAAFT
jgi:hypothetical protein